MGNDDAHQLAPTSLSSSLPPVSSSRGEAPHVVRCFVHQSTPNHAVVLSTVSALFEKKASTSSSTASAAAVIDTAASCDTSVHVLLKDLYSAVLRCLSNESNDATPSASYAVYATCCVSHGRVQHPPFLLPSSDELTLRNEAIPRSASIVSLCKPFVDYRDASRTAAGEGSSSSTTTMLSVSISVRCKESGVSPKDISFASPTFCSQPEREPDADENADDGEEQYLAAFLRDAIRGASIRGRGRGGTNNFDPRNYIYDGSGQGDCGWGRGRGQGRGGKERAGCYLRDSDSSSDDEETPEWFMGGRGRGRGRGGGGRSRGRGYYR